MLVVWIFKFRSYNGEGRKSVCLFRYLYLAIVLETLQESGSEKSALAYKAAVEKYMGNSARFFTLLNQPEDKKDIRSIIVCTAESWLSVWLWISAGIGYISEKLRQLNQCTYTFDFSIMIGHCLFFVVTLGSWFSCCFGREMLQNFTTERRKSEACRLLMGLLITLTLLTDDRHFSEGNIPRKCSGWRNKAKLALLHKKTFKEITLLLKFIQNILRSESRNLSQ